MFQHVGMNGNCGAIIAVRYEVFFFLPSIILDSVLWGPKQNAQGGIALSPFIFHIIIQLGALLICSSSWRAAQLQQKGFYSLRYPKSLVISRLRLQQVHHPPFINDITLAFLLYWLKLSPLLYIIRYFWYFRSKISNMVMIRSVQRPDQSWYPDLITEGIFFRNYTCKTVDQNAL